MPKIRRIEIQNFRSIRSIDLSVKDLTVIVGDNDSGKSNILRALNLFFNGETSPGQPLDFATDYNKFYDPGRHAKRITVSITLELPPGYRNTNGDVVRWTKVWQRDREPTSEYHGLRRRRNKRGGTSYDLVEIPTKSNVHSLLSRIEFEYVPAIRSAEYFRQLRGRIYGVISEVAGEFRQRSAEFEEAIRQNVQTLMDDVLEDLKDDTELRLPDDLSGIFERLDFLTGEAAISLDHRGDGIKGRYIPLILKFIAEKKRTLYGRGGQPYTFIWAYEEPENNMEFGRAEGLAGNFRQLARDELTQVLLTTHSPIFFNMTAAEPALCSAVHVYRRDNRQGTVLSGAADETASLDERMGVMSIIAPYVRQAQDHLEELRLQEAELRRELAAAHRERGPTIFVEGASDKLVLSELLRRFRPEEEAVVYIATPPRRAGANYVTNMLRAWEYRTKHQEVADRRRAVGVIDDDAEGRGAMNRFEMAKAAHITLLRPSLPPHLDAAYELGFEIPICLEELWPGDWWREAEANGWLAERDMSTVTSDRLMQRLARDDVRLRDLLHEDWRIFAERSAAPDHKTAWALTICRKSDEDLMLGASVALALLDQALAELT